MSSPAAFGDEQLRSFIEIATGQKSVPRPEGSFQETQLVQLVQGLRSQGESDTSMDRVRWAMTDAFYANSQWLGMNRQTGMPYPVQQMKGRPRITLNVFQKWIDTAVSRLLSAKPKLVINPGSSDDAVIGAAKACSRVVGEHYWRAMNMDAVMAEFVSGYYKHGDAGLKVEWNPKGGKRLPDVEKPLRDAAGNRIQAVMPGIDEFSGMETDVPAFAEDGITPIWEPERDPITGQPVMLPAYEGAIETSYYSASDIFWDPAASRPEDAMWLILSTTRSPAWVFSRYEVEVDSQPSNRQFDSWRFRRDVRPTRPLQTVQVDELWIRKGKYRFGDGPNDVIEMKTGYVVVVAGGKVLSQGENPYDHGEFPFCFERAQIDDKRMRGLTPANSEREVQVGINKCASSVGHIIDVMGDPQYWEPVGCNIPQADKINGPGVYKRYTLLPGQGKPEIIPPVSPPQGTFEFLRMLRQDFGADISGQHEGGLAGGAPAGVEAGVAMEAIVERDNTAMVLVAGGIGRLVARWGFLVTKLVQQFEPERKQIAVAGEWNETEILEFGGLDVSETFEFDVAPGSYLPQSKAAEFQKDLVLFDKQILSQRDFAKRHGMDDIQALSLPQKDCANARRENWEAQSTGMITTPPEVIMSIDDAMVHMEEHAHLLKDRNFMRQNPLGFQALMQHQMAHQQVAMMMAAQAAAAQAQAQGPPPDGGDSGGGPPSQNQAA